MTNDFVIVGACAARPTGVQRFFLDALCRWTGHLLRGSRNSQYVAENRGRFRTSHCYRCWRWGYVENDYWPTSDPIADAITRFVESERFIEAVLHHVKRAAAAAPRERRKTLRK